VKNFSGILTNSGILDIADHLGASTPDEHLGCKVLMRGYIADKVELSRCLGLKPSTRTSDVELMCSAFRKWGQSLQTHVLGEFAAVIFDMQTKTGLLTHDALGLVPLFYTRKPNGLVFSTDILDIVDIKSSEALDEEYLADVISIGFITGERTPYSRVRRLLPGQSLWYSDGQFEEIKTWNLADVPAVRCSNDLEYEEQFRSLLEAGVQASFDEQGVTWIALSGGVDSSSIACVASRSGARGLAAYSIVCPSWPHVDEQQWMKAVVDMYGLPWYKVNIESILPFSILPRHFYGEPTGAVICEKQLQVENELFSAHGVGVMLSGFGGDDVLGRSPGRVPIHLADPLFDGDFVASLRGVADWRAGSEENRSYSYWLLRTLLEPAVDHIRGIRVRRRHQRLSLPPWLNRDYVTAMDVDERVQKQVAPRCRHPGRQSLWSSLWLQSLELATLPYPHMSYEPRNPLMYRPLVEFMCGIPWEQKLRPRCDRYLQRRALKGILPELVRRRATKGSGNPSLVEGLRRSPDWITYLCDRSMMAEHGIVDAELWQRAVKQASVGQTHDDRFFMAGVTIEVWLRQLHEWRHRKLDQSSLHSAS
jgi:asparagine synthase (glutamine-hydrolysing)